MGSEAFYDTNIERAVLSTCIYEPYRDDLGSLFLHDSDLFYHPFHSSMYEVIKELVEGGKPVDEEFVRIGLVRRKQFDEVAFLDVLGATPLGGVGAYVEELVELKQRRDANRVSIEVRKRLLDSSEPAGDILAWASEEYEKRLTTGGLLSIKSMDAIEAKEPEFLTKEWLPVPIGSVTLLSASGGTGKTWVVLQHAVRAAMEDRSLNVFLWLTEDHEGIVKSRLDAVCSIVGDVGEDVKRRIYISSDAPLVMLRRERGSFKISPKFRILKRTLSRFGLIVIDPLLAFFGGDENDNGQARLFMQPWVDWAREDMKSILFVHHSKKGQAEGPKSRGAGAFVDAVRVAYEIEKVMHKREGRLVPKPSALHMRKFRLTKDNWGVFKHLDEFEFERHITPAKSAREVEICFEPKIDMPVIA